MKNIYLIVGPSGSGKTTVAKQLERDFGMNLVESFTTRLPRFPDEEGHIFVSDEEFDSLGEMCAYTEYNGYRYGVTPEIIDRNDIYVIDPYGVQYMQNHYHGPKGIKAIRLLLDENTCKERMCIRGDDMARIDQRILQDRKSFGIAEKDIHYDLMLPNYNQQSTVMCIASYIGCVESLSAHIDAVQSHLLQSL